MSTVDRYIARTFAFSYVLLVVAGIAMYIVFDLLLNFDEFTKDRAKSTWTVLSEMADYYGYNVPLFFSQLGGVMLGIAAGFTFAMMLRSNEMTALVASGVPLQRLIVPVVLCASLFVGLWWANREWVIPSLAHKISRQREDVLGTRTAGVYSVPDDKGNIVIALRYHPREAMLGQAFIIEAESGGRRHLIEADSATYDPQRKTWKLDRGRRIVMAADAQPGLGAPIQYESLSEFKLRLTPEQLVLKQAAEWSDLLSLHQMNRIVESSALANRPSIIMSRHVRLTQPLLQFIMILLVAPAFLTREPSNVLISAAKALLWAGLFFLTSFVAHSIIRSDHAALIAWLPILLFGPAAVMRLANVKT